MSKGTISFIAKAFRVLRSAYWQLLGCLLIAAIGSGLYFFGRNRIVEGIYRNRIEQLARDHSRLAAAYNDVVRKTAVTEIEVKDGRISVLVKTAEGLLTRLQTPFSPANELYIDFVVRNGRLWIRRLFDSRTPPGEGFVVDPELAQIDWNAPGYSHGKAVYRKLDEGRWVATVTGNGALGLSKVLEKETMPLVSAPRIIDFQEYKTELQSSIDSVTLREIVQFFSPDCLQK